MKNVIRLLIPGLVFTMLFASCGSNKSLTQRHYNNRYYIDMSKSESTETVLSDRDAGTNENTPLIAGNEVTYLPEKNIEVDFSLCESDKSGPVSFNENETYSASEKEPLNVRTGTDRKLSEYPASLLKKTTAVKEKLTPSPTTEGDALSLLWIVIIILLILWLLGFGFGVGGAIHVLALIALILLILWLLRII